MPDLTKKDIKEIFVETLEPFAEATQKDHEKLDRKIDVNTMKLDNRLTKVEFELREVKQDVKWMKDNFSELFTKLDKFIALYEKQEHELLILSEHMRRLEERIVKLETERK